MRFIPVVDTDGNSLVINLDNVCHIKQSAYPSSPRMNDPMLVFHYNTPSTPTCVFGTFADIRYDIFPSDSRHHR